MALITCPDCGGSVSDAAPACIHCGRPLAPARPAAPYAAPAYAPPSSAYAAADPMARRVDAKDARAASAKPVAMVVYVLFFLSFLYFIPGIVGLIVAYIKRGDARGTWVESHFDWQIETFWKSLWWGLGLVVLGVLMAFVTEFAELLVLLLYPAALAVTLWFIYRMVRGALALYDERPIF